MKIRVPLPDGNTFFISIKEAQSLVQVIQKQLDSTPEALADFTVTKEYLYTLFSSYHEANSRRAGRLWARMTLMYAGSGITLMCDLCGGEVHRRAHFRHHEANEYLSARDILAHQAPFIGNRVRGAGKATIADFKFLCEKLEERLNKA